MGQVVQKPSFAGVWLVLYASTQDGSGNVLSGARWRVLRDKLSIPGLVRVRLTSVWKENADPSTGVGHGSRGELPIHMLPDGFQH